MNNKIINSEFAKRVIWPVLNKVTNEYGYTWESSHFLDDDPNTLRVCFNDRPHDRHLTYIFDFTLICATADPYIVFENLVRDVLEDWTRNDSSKKYRDILVDQIKSAGQQLVDRAEEMVSDKAQYLKGCSINIDIQSPSDEPVTISWTLETFDTNILK